MNDDQTKRGEFIKRLVVLPAAVAGLAAATGAAEAASKSNKAALKYQDNPKDGKKCAGCQLYIPGKKPTDRGGCKVVAGSISPNGYCIAYAPKQH